MCVMSENDEILRQNVAFLMSGIVKIWKKSPNKSNTSSFSLHSECAAYIYYLLLFS